MRRIEIHRRLAGTIVLAHRGLHRTERENTVAAFRAAARVGADGVELDVRRTRDQVLVLHHDPSLTRLGPLVEVMAAELPAWMPTLAQALDACAGMAMVNVEIKADPDGPDVAAQVAALLGARLSEPGPRLLVSSFDLATIDAHRAAAPGVATGWLTVAADATVVATVAERGHAMIHPHHALIDAALLAAARRHDLGVVAWTVDDPARAAELAALGVEVLISNEPDRVRPLAS
jgi:glycerophosphoryl diester phosphodiesterase